MNVAAPALLSLPCDICGTAPCRTPGFCDGCRADNAEREKDGAPEPPRPLMRELPPADPFPVDALGAVLAPVARAIHDRIQAPIAICAQSVLATATLAVQGHANVELPTGHAKPLSSYFVTVAASGERKSAVDHEALWPVCRRETVLRESTAASASTTITRKPPGKRRVRLVSKSRKVIARVSNKHSTRWGLHRCSRWSQF